MTTTTATKEKQETLFDVADADESGSYELIPASQATAPLRERGEPIMMTIARHPDGLEMLNRATQAVIHLRKAGLRMTGPADWVAMKGKDAPDDQAFCMLTKSGADRIAPFFQIRTEPAEPTDEQGAFAPRIERGEDGEIMLHAWTTAHCGITGETVRVSISRSNKEDFVGRTRASVGASPLTERADLARSTETGLKTKAVRVLGGFSKVPIGELADIGINTDLIPRGAGWGSSKQRGASKVAGDDVKAKAKDFADELLKRTNGDKSAAGDLCRDCTANPPKFGGFTSPNRFTELWQVDSAWKKLREHPVFGDKAQQGGNGGDS